VRPRAAAKADAAAAAASSSKAAGLIKACVYKPNSMPAPALLSAMLELEAAKLPVSLDWVWRTCAQSLLLCVRRLHPFALTAAACPALALQTDGWQELLEAPGTRWRLIFTAGVCFA
jgi:hypothetical protein